MTHDFEFTMQINSDAFGRDIYAASIRLRYI